MGVRKAVVSLLTVLALASCGGGMGADTQVLSATSSVPSVKLDLACCSSYDPQTGDCTLVPSSGKTFTITVRNDSLDWFDKEQAVSVKGCSFELIPIGATPDAPKEATSYLSCTTPTINSGETGEVQISIPDAFVSLFKDLYFSSGLDAFAYQLNINLTLVGQESGEYRLTVPVVLEMADYPIGAPPEENLCQTQNDQTQNEGSEGE